MNSTITRDVPPFFLVSGTPAKFMRWNKYQLDKLDIGGVPSGDIYDKYVKQFIILSTRNKIQNN